MKNLLKEIIEDNEIANWHLILFLSLLGIIVEVVLQNYIYTIEFYDIIYSKIFDPTSIEFLYTLKIKTAIWKYLAIPIFVLFRSVFLALLIQSSLMIRFFDITFSKILRISLLGLFVLLLAPIARVIYLAVIPVESLTENILSLVPFSLATLININDSNTILVSILNSINVFEVLWILTIAYGLRVIAKLSTNNSIITSLSIWSLIFLFQMGIVLFVFNK